MYVYLRTFLLETLSKYKRRELTVGLHSQLDRWIKNDRLVAGCKLRYELSYYITLSFVNSIRTKEGTIKRAGMGYLIWRRIISFIKEITLFWADSAAAADWNHLFGKSLNLSRLPV